jgi:ubiquinone/menaquinone biosynthesis C-methylase UbiE
MGTSLADWDRLSGIYDRQLWLERRAIQTALELARPARETALLDAGTGTGALLRALAIRPDPPRHVVGVDSSEAMLARVGPLPEGWRLVRADVAALPFDDESFDTATAIYLLHVLAPGARAAALGELRRVLRPGGRLVTVTLVLPSRALSRPFWWALGELARSMPSRFCGMRPLDPRPELLRAGFRIERARTVRRGYYSLCVSAQPADKMEP